MEERAGAGHVGVSEYHDTGGGRQASGLKLVDAIPPTVCAALHGSALRGEQGGLREVAIEALAGCTLGHGLHQVLTANKAALPGGARAPERLRTVAARSWRLEADLEGAQLTGDALRQCRVVTGDG